MTHTRRSAVALTCLAALGTCAAAMADQRSDINAYVLSVMNADMVDACKARAPALAGDMAAALTAWTTPRAAAIASGKAAIGGAMPELGATPQARESAIHDLFAKGAGAGIAANPADSCEAGLNTLRFGIPVPIEGSTRTGEELRMDLYQQARVTAACERPESIGMTIDPGRAGAASWAETWVVKGCGKQVPLRITLTPTAGGGTDFTFSRLPQ